MMYQSNDPGFSRASRSMKLPSSERGASTRSATAKTPADWVKSGRRSYVIPGARPTRRVTTRESAVRSAPRPTSSRPISLTLSPARAGSSANGGYVVHHERGASPVANEESTIAATPARPSQSPPVASCGRARSRAPIWSGTSATASPSTRGSNPPYVSSVACIVTTLAYVPSPITVASARAVWIATTSARITLSAIPKPPTASHIVPTRR